MTDKQFQYGSCWVWIQTECVPSTPVLLLSETPWQKYITVDYQSRETFLELVRERVMKSTKLLRWQGQKAFLILSETVSDLVIFRFWPCQKRKMIASESLSEGYLYLFFQAKVPCLWWRKTYHHYNTLLFNTLQKVAQKSQNFEQPTPSFRKSPKKRRFFVSYINRRWLISEWHRAYYSLFVSQKARFFPVFVIGTPTLTIIREEQHL